MDNVPKWSETFKNLAAFAARFLKCVGPFWDITITWLNVLSLLKFLCHLIL